MAYALRCPDCRGKFPWNPLDGMPAHCQLCKAEIGPGHADDDVVLPFYRRAATTATDNVYRAMEAASERRVEQAAAMAGCSPEEMSALKITNLNDRRDAEIAAMPVNNAVTQFAEQNKIDFFRADGAQYSAGTQSGPLPNAGARMRTVLHQHHAQVTKGAAVSDRPANETLQPGYRRRG